jgi:hypothetical protein
VTVVSHKRRADDDTVALQNDYSGGWASVREVEILRRIVPGTRERTTLPKFNYCSLVSQSGFSHFQLSLLQKATVQDFPDIGKA